VKKIGVAFSPHPAVVLLYTEGGQTRRREMPLRDLKSDSDCRSVVGRLRLRHKKHLESIGEVKLEKLVMLAREHLRGHSLSRGLEEVSRLLKIDPEEDLNKLSDEELQRRKDIMDLDFEKNSIGKGHPDFVYDKEVDFDGEKEEGGWDDETDDADDESTPRNTPLSVEPNVGVRHHDEKQFSAAEHDEDEEDFW